jgi:hypothetical protein
MSEAKHTPGPWEASGDEVIGAIDWTYHVASAWSNHQIEPDEAAANAKLIAAAPDLLAACEACIAADELANADGTLGDDMVAAYDAAIASAKASIAKAKGQSA